MNYLICGVLLTLLSCGTSWAEDSNSAANASSTEQGKTWKADPINTNEKGCLKLSTYKVRATERLKENETWRLGYTTCVDAREFQMRSADINLLSDETQSRTSHEKGTSLLVP
jgi:hypothetical protein